MKLTVLKFTGWKSNLCSINVFLLLEDDSWVKPVWTSVDSHTSIEAIVILLKTLLKLKCKKSLPRLWRLTAHGFLIFHENQETNIWNRVSEYQFIFGYKIIYINMTNHQLDQKASVRHIMTPSFKAFSLFCDLYKL